MSEVCLDLYNVTLDRACPLLGLSFLHGQCYGWRMSEWKNSKGPGRPWAKTVILKKIRCLFVCM